MALQDSSSSTTLYGEFPTYLISQRASSAQATTLVSATSTAFSASHSAYLVEIGNTLIALGYWKGSA